MTRNSLWALLVFVAVWAGVMDWRYRRIPNWLTISGLVVGLVVNTVLDGWPGAKASLLGAGLGLALLLPFVMLKAIGAGDWKLMGALGAFLGPSRLVTVLVVSMIVAGVMAIVLVIVKGRLLETLRNMGRLLMAFANLHLPPREVSLDNPEAVKVPFGVAVAVTVVLVGVRQLWGRF